MDDAEAWPPPYPPETRCIVCDRPSIDHTWRHPATMIDHYLTRLLDYL